MPLVAQAIGALTDELLAEQVEDAIVAARAARRVGGSRWDVLPQNIGAWVESGHPDQRAGALMLAGNAGVRFADATYSRALEAPETREAAVYALGMSQHPYLTSLADDARDDVAGAARWWLTEGARVTG